MIQLVSLTAILVVSGIDPGTPTERIPPARIQFSHMRLPARGTIYKEMLYGFLNDEWSLPGQYGRPDWSISPLDGIPLNDTNKSHWKKYEFLHTGHGWNFRFNIEYGYAWRALDPTYIAKLTLEELRDFDTVERSKTTKKDPKWGIPPGYGQASLFRKYLKIHSEWNHPVMNPARGISGYGIIPTSKDSCVCYMLTKNIKKFELWDNTNDDKMLDTFDSLFDEDFYFFIRNGDYYFVTETGKLYQALAPRDGEKSRKMKGVITDPDRPIVAILEDADCNKVWMFVKDKNAVNKHDFYFELNDNIEPGIKTFDPLKLTPSNAAGRAKLLLEYLPLIAGANKK